MRKRIILLGSMLMAITSPLYADISGNNDMLPDGPQAAFCLQITLSPVSQIAGSLMTDTQDPSFLDTHGPLSTMTGNATGISDAAPAFEVDASLAPVPEPTHYMLMGLGLVGLYLARRDRLGAK